MPAAGNQWAIFRKDFEMKNLQMGVQVKCRITGFVGIVAGRTEYINGCIQWLVKPPVDKDGKSVEGQWIDECNLEVIGDGIIVVTPEKIPGGPRMDAPSQSYQG